VYSDGEEGIGYQLVGISETRSIDETANIYNNPQIVQGSFSLSNK
jgi:hypothetical protein